MADLRFLPIVENVVGIYKSLDVAFYANLSQNRSPGKVVFFLLGSLWVLKFI